MSAAQASVRVAAGRERAFTAFAGELSQWWRPHPMFATTPRAPGLLRLDPPPPGRLLETLANGREFEVGRVTAWEPPARLAFTWRPAALESERATEVEVRFDAVGDQTRVTVTHSGWERVPAAHVARHGFPDAVLLRRLGEWWSGQLGRYKACAADAGGDSDGEGA